MALEQAGPCRTDCGQGSPGARENAFLAWPVKCFILWELVGFLTLSSRYTGALMLTPNQAPKFSGLLASAALSDFCAALL